MLIGSDPPVVAIAATERCVVLKGRTWTGSRLLVFDESESLRALDAILRRRPGVVLLEPRFAATARGAQLVSVIRTHSALSSCDIRVFAREEETAEAEPPETPAAFAQANTVPLLREQCGTRREPRVRTPERVPTYVDGHTAVMLDISRRGAQLRCRRALRPGQRVRLTLRIDRVVHRLAGTVAWSAFEPAGAYRVGIEFSHPAEQAVFTDLCVALGAPSETFDS